MRRRGLQLEGPKQLRQNAQNGQLVVNRLHPLAYGLTALYCPALNPFVDLTGIGPVLAKNGTPVMDSGAYGPEWAGAHSAGLRGLSLPAQEPTTTASAWCLFSYGTSADLASNPPIFGVEYNTALSTPFWCIELGVQTGSNPILGWNNASYQQITGSTTLTVGRYYSLAGTVTTGGNAFLYQDGVQVATAAAAAGTIGYTVTSGVAIGVNSQTMSPNSGFVIGGLWNRQITLAEVALLSSDPFVLLRPEPRPSFGRATAIIAPPIAVYDRPYIGIWDY